MKLAFFEVNKEDINFFQQYFKGKDASFFAEPLSSENIQKAKDAEIISIFIYSKINSDIIRQLTNLKFITTRSMGFDHIDLDACKKAKVKVSTAPHYGDNSVAEHTFGLILSLSRNIHKAYLRTINKNYSIEGLEGWDLQGKTLGVIGVGRIGSKVIKIAKGFGMEVLACNTHKDKKLAKDLKFSYSPLNKILKESDIITMHIPYTKENHHFIDSKKLSLMKKEAIFINTSRGAIVDTKALVNALEEGKIAGAGLDVLEGEELIKEEKIIIQHIETLDIEKMRQLAIDHELLNNERVVFTPHIAFYSKEAVRRIQEATKENIKSFIKGKPINIIN